ncbi:flagellar hook-length control protein FliK [Treponema sp.]|uniref:flagellar hook-length control protein FliK n=1 Tax=Treponema sp. TaxID=166 RepID=UPI003890D81A
MNILSISQVQAQSSQNDFPQMNSAERYDSEKMSFSDFLRDAKRANENDYSAKNETSSSEKNVSKENENVSNNEEKFSEKNVNENHDEKSEKIAEKNSSDDEKTKEEQEFHEKSSVNPENSIAMNITGIQGTEQLNYQSENIDFEEKTLVLGEDNNQIDDKTLVWLMSSAKLEEKGDEMSSEDFAKMIDAAVEFIPGSETDEEKLESAQNLAVNDPEKFLKNIESGENISRLAEIEKRGLPKSQLISESDKTASSKEKKNDVKLSVHDLRTHHLFDETDAKAASDKIVQKSAEKKEINLSMQRQNDGNVQMTMELADRAQQNITSSSSQTASANGSDFQHMLSNAVQENAPEFVKAGNIILKDNNQGSINLIFRPEGLGNVKISLNLDDKNLSAQITVQTKEAMDAFRESIPGLKQAFTESGFETGSFDLNFSNNENQQGFAQNENQNQHNSELAARKTYGDFVTPDALSAESVEAYSGGSYEINIVA